MKKFLVPLLFFILATTSLAQTTAGERRDYKTMVAQESTPPTPLPFMVKTRTGTGLNDLRLGTTYNQTVMATFVVTVTAVGSPNQFGWTKTGGSGSASASNVAITGASQTLSDAFAITFTATTGHTNGNTWTIKVFAVGNSYWNATTASMATRWSNSTTTVMTGAGGAPASSFDQHSPGAIGDIAPGSIKGTSIIATTDITTPSIYGSNNDYQVQASHQKMGSGFDLAWSSTAGYNGSLDVGLKRSSAGLIQITDGSSGYGGVDASYIRTSHGTSNLAHVLLRGWTNDPNYGAIYMGAITTPSDTNWSIVANAASGDLGSLFLNGTDINFRISNSTKLILNSSNLELSVIPKFGGTNSTGAGTALLGATNCPASTLSAVYTWITAVAADGSTVYIPCWK